MKYYSKFDFKKSGILIGQAIKEDVGKGDITSEYLISQDKKSKAVLKFKDTGIIAGLKIFRQVFEIIDRNVRINLLFKDGDSPPKGSIIAELWGNTRSLLKGERISLNIIQRMSGIASSVTNMKEILNNDKIKLIDTRKTTPNFRIFEKLAVRIGGGTNHRFGLYDMILIKDNHIEANGGIRNTLAMLGKIKKRTELKVELEVKNLDELKTAVNYGKGLVDIVMLDNFPISDVKKAVKMIKNRFKVEISGGITLGNIHKYSGIKGINFISAGFLTHSVRSSDISLDFIS